MAIKKPATDPRSAAASKSDNMAMREAVAPRMGTAKPHARVAAGPKDARAHAVRQAGLNGGGASAREAGEVKTRARNPTAVASIPPDVARHPILATRNQIVAGLLRTWNKIAGEKLSSEVLFGVMPEDLVSATDFAARQ